MLGDDTEGMTTDSPLASSFTQARNYYPGRRCPVRLVVVHTIEAPETEDRAEWCAQYFAGASAPVASAHYMVDPNSITQGVREAHTAWAAPGANADGIQIEQAGYAGQTASQWDDAPSKALLDRTARLIADLCVRHNLPIRHLTNDQLKAGERGVIGHRQASQVYRLSDHTDPGDNFPWDKVIAQAKMYATGAKPVVSPKPATGTKIAEDGVLGPNTVKALQKAVGTVQDGVIGGRKTASQTVTALQKLLNTKSGAKLSVDGYMGPATTTALQKYVGSTPDGLLGPKTILALQRKLNSGKF